jgi:hypothetical protein
MPATDDEVCGIQQSSPPRTVSRMKRSFQELRPGQRFPTNDLMSSLVSRKKSQALNFNKIIFFVIVV